MQTKQLVYKTICRDTIVETDAVLIVVWRWAETKMRRSRTEDTGATVVEPTDSVAVGTRCCRRLVVHHKSSVFSGLVVVGSTASNPRRRWQIQIIIIIIIQDLYSAMESKDTEAFAAVVQEEGICMGRLR